MNLGKHLTTREREINPTVVFQTSSIPLVLGKYQWGPVNTPILCQNLNDFINIFGEPVKDINSNVNNRHEWFAVDDLFNYNTSVFVNRVTGQNSKNAGLKLVQELSFELDNITGSFAENDVVSITFSDTSFTGNVRSFDDSDSKIRIKNINGVSNLVNNYQIGLTLNGATVSDTGLIKNVEISNVLVDSTLEDNILIKSEDDIITENINVSIANNEIMKIIGRYTGALGNDIKIVYCDHKNFNTFNFNGISMKRFFNRANINVGEIAILVLKQEGSAVQILESHLGSINPEAKDEEGRNIFIDEVIFRNSNYIYTFTNSAKYLELSKFLENETVTVDNLGFIGETNIPKALTFGYDDIVTNSDIITSLSNIEELSINFKYIVDSNISVDNSIKSAYVTLCEKLETATAVIAIDPNEINKSGSQSQIANSIINYKKELGINSSYGSLAGNIKWRYDRFNDEFFWTGMASDLAGLRILSDNNTFEWYTAAGFNRGIIRNAGSIGRLACYPTGEILDDLNVNKINAFISSPQDGIICMGDNTLLNTNTGLSKLHIRMLLVVLKQSIKDYIKREIYEFNNVYTRNRISTTISQFLERVLANQGITDFRVICDESNNTPAVIDNNELICDIYIRPVRSAEFITLTFTSVGESVKFDEII